MVHSMNQGSKPPIANTNVSAEYRTLSATVYPAHQSRLKAMLKTRVVSAVMLKEQTIRVRESELYKSTVRTCNVHARYKCFWSDMQAYRGVISVDVFL